MGGGRTDRPETARELKQESENPDPTPVKAASTKRLDKKVSTTPEPANDNDQGEKEKGRELSRDRVKLLDTRRHSQESRKLVRDHETLICALWNENKELRG
ncbi:hypothetical protein N7453_009019 [Penicillium expansum]|nr:hypothetical protein N7453_009019 [Penicillium expansum]